MTKITKALEETLFLLLETELDDKKTIDILANKILSKVKTLEFIYMQKHSKIIKTGLKEILNTESVNKLMKSFDGIIITTKDVPDDRT